MTIRILKDRIEFNNYTLRETSTGFSFNGIISTSQVSGRYYAGTIAGFHSGGRYSPGTTSSRIDRFAFNSDTASTTPGNLVYGRFGISSVGSRTSGYTVGGYSPSLGSIGNLDKFSFVSNANAVELTPFNPYVRGSSYNTDAGGQIGYFFSTGSTTTNNVTGYAIPFASDIVATVPNSGTALSFAGGAKANSTTSGYNICGVTPGGSPTVVTTIRKFLFAVPYYWWVNVGDLDNSRTTAGDTGHSSKIAGIIYGGPTGAGGGAGLSTSKNISKFPFATDVCVNIGDMSLSTPGLINNETQGHDTLEHGYMSNAYAYPTVTGNLYRFPFAAETAGHITNVQINGGTGKSQGGQHHY
jgi:hypothetical protein